MRCRGCRMLGEAGDMHPLKGAIKNLFLKCSSLELLPGDPEQICVHCFRQTTAWASFRIMVQTKEKNFRKRFLLAKDPVIPDVGIVKREPEPELSSPIAVKEEVWRPAPLLVEVKSEIRMMKFEISTSTLDERLDSHIVESMEMKSQVDIGLKWEIYDESDDEEVVEKPKLEETEEYVVDGYDGQDDLDQNLDLEHSFYSQLFTDLESASETEFEDDSSKDTIDNEVDPIGNAEDLIDNEITGDQSDNEEVHVGDRDDQNVIGVDHIEEEMQDDDYAMQLDEEVSQSSSTESEEFQEVPAVLSEQQEFSEPCICPLCYAEFIDEMTLRAHLKRDHVFGQYPKCPICNIRLTRITKIYSHIISCHKTPQTSNEVVKSQSTVSTPAQRKEDDVKCPICNIHFDRYMLYSHLRDAHLGQERGQCPFCKKNFAKLFVHCGRMHCHAWTCPICPSARNKRFLLVDSFNEHITCDHPEVPVEGFCPICHTAFDGFAAFCNHLKKDHKDLKCPLCPSQIESCEELAIHLLDKCKGAAAAKTALNPVLVNPVNILGTIKCDICNETFMTAHQYSTHYKGQHSRKGGKTIQTSTLKKRIKIFKQCPSCKKTFPNLYFHLLRRACCRFCGKKICSIKSMKKHIEEWHRGGSGKCGPSIFVKYSYN